MSRYASLNTAPAVFGFRKTRSGAAFSPWDADAGAPLHAPSTLDLDALLRASLKDKGELTGHGEVAHEDEPELEELGSRKTGAQLPPRKTPESTSPTSPRPGRRIFSSPPPTSPQPLPVPTPPPSFRVPTPFASLLVPTPSSAHQATSPAAARTSLSAIAIPGASYAAPIAASAVLLAVHAAPLGDGLTKAEFHRLKKKLRKREDRFEDRAKKQHEAGLSLKAAAMKHRSGGAAFAADFALRPDNVHVASTGVIGRALRVVQSIRRGMSLKASSSLGFDYAHWSGKNNCYIADRHGTMFATLVGQPRDPEWPNVIKRVTQSFARAQRRMADLEDEPDHRRGKYFAGHLGHSIGSGQKRPGNLCNSDGRQAILEDLRADPDVRRVANFASVSLKNYFPEVYKVYKNNMDALLANDPLLRRNFDNNVFSAATFNLGPRVVTRVHLDHLNYAYGMCAVLALGKYNYKKGGHIILWDAKLIIEFPPGATILLPSAILRHSNVSIGRHETRYSFTQYTAGGLFRWVRAGFKTLRSLHAEGLDLESEYQEWKDGWKLFPTLADMYGQ